MKSKRLILAGWCACWGLHAATAQVVTEAATGWYDSTGGHSSSSDYIVESQIHDYFVFDLSGISSPITSAIFSAQEPSFGYQSENASDVLDLVGVSGASASFFTAGAGGTAAYDLLADGEPVGSSTVDASHAAPWISVDLTSGAALAFLNAYLGEDVVLGGSSPTLGSGSYLFGFTFDPYVGEPTAELMLTTQAMAAAVPEPAALIWGGLGVLALAALRRRKGRLSAQ